jgi:hypothetical protein
MVKLQRTNNDLQNITENLTIEQHKLYYKQGMNSSAPPSGLGNISWFPEFISCL